MNKKTVPCITQNHKVLVLALALFLFIGSFVGCIGKQENEIKKQLFDLNWKFCSDEFSSVDEIDFNDESWAEVDLPYEWSSDKKTQQKDSEEVTGWYVKSFHIPPLWKNKQISIYFEGIDNSAKVFINGTSLGIQSKGNNRISCDLTKYLDYKKENNIAVCVTHPNNANELWTNNFGIYKHVWLIITDSNLFGSK